MSSFAGRLALQQRVLPAYRIAFFDLLAQACDGGLSVFAGQPLLVEGIVTAERLQKSSYTPGVNRHFCDPSSKLYLCWQQGIREWLVDWDPEVLIVEANPRYLSTRLAVRWMHKRGRPVLGWGLGAPTLSGILSPVRRWNRHTFLRTLDGAISYSRRGAAEYQAIGLPPERILAATNAAMPRPISAPPERSLEFSRRPMVLFVGRLQSRKRLDILLRACSALPQELAPRLVIVGEGPAKGEFEKIAAQIYPQAEFVGAKYGTDSHAYFQAADLFALPGTGGLAVQQAMSFGLPVIVAKGDGTQDDLVRPSNGWLVPPGDQAVLTEVIEDAFSDISRLRRMGEESYRIVAEEVNLNEMVKVFISAVNQVL